MHGSNGCSSTARARVRGVGIGELVVGERKRDNRKERGRV